MMSSVLIATSPRPRRWATRRAPRPSLLRALARTMRTTSGSTGKPKGVLLSHASRRCSIERNLALNGDMTHHRYIVAAPMFHKQPGAALDEAAVKAYSIANGPAFAHPRFVEFIEAIPLAAT